MMEFKKITSGKKFTKQTTTFYPSTKEGIKAFIKVHNERFETFEQVMERNKQWAIEFLTKSGLEVWDDHKNYHGYVIRSKEKGGAGYAHDSLQGLAAEMLKHLFFLVSDEVKINDRLMHAIHWGECSKLFDVYADLQNRQTKVAKSERKKGLTDIFNKLRVQKNEGATPKDLWPVFVSMLKESHETFDKVIEIENNPSNCKSWSVSFSIIPARDGDPIKDDRMTYGRFLGRLREK